MTKMVIVTKLDHSKNGPMATGLLTLMAMIIKMTEGPKFPMTKMGPITLKASFSSKMAPIC